jgi:hypothetical protein
MAPLIPEPWNPGPMPALAMTAYRTSRCEPRSDSWRLRREPIIPPGDIGVYEDLGRSSKIQLGILPCTR